MKLNWLLDRVLNCDLQLRLQHQSFQSLWNPIMSTIAAAFVCYFWQYQGFLCLSNRNCNCNLKPLSGYSYIESEEFPCFASIHIEFLEPSVEHNENENDLALITPFPHKTNPLVLAGCLWMQLSFTTVSCSKPHVPIRTDTHMHPKYTHMLIQIINTLSKAHKNKWFHVKNEFIQTTIW